MEADIDRRTQKNKKKIETTTAGINIKVINPCRMCGKPMNYIHKQWCSSKAMKRSMENEHGGFTIIIIIWFIGLVMMLASS